MKIKEVCSCGASFAIGVSPNVPVERWDWRMDQIKDWRQSHIHEMPVEPDQPLIHESVGTHERAEPFWPEEVRQPIGFRANH